MRRLTVGDRVIALRNPFVAEGTKGIIKVDDHSSIPYRVLFEGDREYWVAECCVRSAHPADEPSSEPTRMLKVGDKVRIKSREWYDTNKDVDGTVRVPFNFTEYMAQLCGKILEIIDIDGGRYTLKGAERWSFSEDMFDMVDSTGRHAFNNVSQVCKSILGVNRESIIKGNLPLIKTNKLLTNIKLD